MSAPISTFENDENFKMWKNQAIETENLIQSMLNDLEVEQARETLLLSEMRGTILRVEQLALKSSQQANERLQNLMVEQLVEINKSEILVKVNEENYRQCATTLQEISRWKPHEPEPLVTKSHVGQDEEKENQHQDKDELKDDERKTIEGDVGKIEEAIAESEKEHAVLIEFLTEHQKLLTEIESGRICNKDDTQVLQDIVTPAQKHQEPPIYQPDWEKEMPTDSLDPILSSSMQKPKTQNRIFQAKSAIINKKVGDFPYTTDGLNGGFGIGLRTQNSLISTSKIEPTPPMKKAKLNLYDAPGPNQPRAAAQIRSQVPQTKSSAAFKPKIPSILRNRIN